MALPKSMRALGAVTICIFFYMILQIYRAPAEIQPPEKAGEESKSKLQNWDHDPQLDRMWSV